MVNQQPCEDSLLFLRCVHFKAYQFCILDQTEGVMKPNADMGHDFRIQRPLPMLNPIPDSGVSFLLKKPFLCDKPTGIYGGVRASRLFLIKQFHLQT